MFFFFLLWVQLIWFRYLSFSFFFSPKKSLVIAIIFLFQKKKVASLSLPVVHFFFCCCFCYCCSHYLRFPDCKIALFLNLIHWSCYFHCFFFVLRVLLWSMVNETKRNH